MKVIFSFFHGRAQVIQGRNKDKTTLRAGQIRPVLIFKKRIRPAVSAKRADGIQRTLHFKKLIFPSISGDSKTALNGFSGWISSHIDPSALESASVKTAGRKVSGKLFNPVFYVLPLKDRKFYTPISCYGQGSGEASQIQPGFRRQFNLPNPIGTKIAPIHGTRLAN